MKRKYFGASLIAVVVVGLIFFFISRKTAVDPMDPTTAESLPVDPAQAVPGPEGTSSAPVDRSARWGFVLFDDVKLVTEAKPDSTSAGEINMHTGDQVYIVDDAQAREGRIKVTMFDGKTGFVDSSKVFEATTYAPWNILDTSTAPIKEWIPEELVPPTDAAKYRVIVGSDFLMRASKNPNPVIAEWAQAVLTGQAEGAAQ
jgi:hypothetical protein